MTGEEVGRRSVIKAVVGVTAGLSGASDGAVADRTTAQNTRGQMVVNNQWFEGEFQQTTVLTASDDNSDDSFGSTLGVSADGNTVIVGTSEDNPYGARSGSASLFDRSGGEWTQQQLTASDGTAEDLFGKSVAVTEDGSTAVVGAPGNEGSGENTGAVYVFDRDGERWQQQKLTLESVTENASVGSAVAVSNDGTTVLVGAKNEMSSDVRVGSAYAFEQRGGEWRQEQLPVGGVRGGDVGSSVSLSGDGETAIVGAPTNGGGTAHIVERTANGWQQEERLFDDNADGDEEFGQSVALATDGTTAVVGAPGDNYKVFGEVYESVGSAFVFRRSDGEWERERKLQEGDDPTRVGTVVGLSGSAKTIILSRKPLYEPYIPVVSESGDTTLSPENDDQSGGFGKSVALSDDDTTALVGAPGDGQNTSGGGAVYIYDRTGPIAISDQQTFVGGSILTGVLGTIALLWQLRKRGDTGTDEPEGWQ
jgi:hypothetical protein